MCCSCLCSCIQSFLSNCCKCLGKSCMAICRGICRCFCNAVSPGCGFLLQIIFYAIFQGFNIGTDFGVFLETSKTYARCDELSTGMLQPLSNDTNLTRPYCVATENATQALLGEKAATLQLLEGVFFFFICLSGGIYVIHIVVLFPNTCKHWNDENFENMVSEAGPYYQKILQIHTLFLLLETLVHDVPMSCLAVELCAQMWGAGGINCWDCALTPQELPKNPMAQINCEMWLGLLLGSIAIVSIYKGKWKVFYLFIPAFIYLFIFDLAQTLPIHVKKIETRQNMAKQNKGKPRNSILLQIKYLLICSPFIYFAPNFHLWGFFHNGSRDFWLSITYQLQTYK